MSKPVVLVTSTTVSQEARSLLQGAGIDIAYVICTPHIASSTTGAGAQMGTIAANSIISYLRGEIYDRRNFINPQVLDVVKRET
jgi:phosphoglycerate dehydrogenase-like enzyme